MVPLEAFPHIDRDCSLREALEVLNTAHIEMHGESSLPRILLVFDGQDHMVGLVRRRDILKGLSPRWFFKSDASHPEAVFDIAVDENIVDVLADKAVSRFQDRSERAIDEYVQAINATVNTDDQLIRLVNIMVKEGYHMLSVLDDGHVVGVVRSTEVIWAVRALLNGQEVSADD